MSNSESDVHLSATDTILIRETAELLQVEAPVIEKDLYVTEAIHALSDLKDDFFHLVFQGGTCLSKAHGAIRRMSEDCDFRIARTPNFSLLTREEQKTYLKYFQNRILDRLEDTGFSLDEKEAVQFGYEGRFMKVRLPYTSQYSSPSVALRPHLLLEFITINPNMPTEMRPITTIVAQTLGEKANHPKIPCECVSVFETTAEKWIALTRRISFLEHQPSSREEDGYVIRHLYDLNAILNDRWKNEELKDLVYRLIWKERERFKANNEYIQNPPAEIDNALKALHSPRWEKEYQTLMEHMVFKEAVVPYEQAVKKLEDWSQFILKDAESYVMDPKWIEEQRALQRHKYQEEKQHISDVVRINVELRRLQREMIAAEKEGNQDRLDQFYRQLDKVIRGIQRDKFLMKEFAGKLAGFMEPTKMTDSKEGDLDNPAQKSWKIDLDEYQKEEDKVAEQVMQQLSSGKFVAMKRKIAELEIKQTMDQFQDLQKRAGLAKTVVEKEICTQKLQEKAAEILSKLPLFKAVFDKNTDMGAAIHQCAKAFKQREKEVELAMGKD